MWAREGTTVVKGLVFCEQTTRECRGAGRRKAITEQGNESEGQEIEIIHPGELRQTCL